jgi:hypothetical protein
MATPGAGVPPTRKSNATPEPDIEDVESLWFTLDEAPRYP